MTDSPEINNKSTKVISGSNNSENKLASLGYEYDREKDIYYKNKDNKEFIKYQVKTTKLTIEKSDNSTLKNYVYYPKAHLIKFSVLSSNSETIVSLKYNVPLNKMECYKGNCENYRSDINHILKINHEISTTLQ